jgi:hypothetical protein
MNDEGYNLGGADATADTLDSNYRRRYCAVRDVQDSALFEPTEVSNREIWS